MEMAGEARPDKPALLNRQRMCLLRHLRSNHKCFWQKLNPVGGALPAALANHSAWEAFHQRLCAPATVNLQPLSVQRPCTIPPSAALDADITEREVELALPKLSNGKAVGGAGWPAELLRYAAHYVTMEDGSRHKVWVLAPLLTRFLNRCFRAGVLPPCISSALVTPIHKKSCTLDAANYRPIAVGEPLYRLYTIILNKRLVGWSEEHQLRSPVQAGSRPGQSPIHHLFALRHFIDTARISRRPLYACFVDLQKAYDTVQHHLLWDKLESIGVGPRMLAAIRSLYSSGTLSMKVAGTAGGPRIQQMGVRQGCPLSPTLFGLFFDGLHDHLHSCASASGIQLRSGKWVSSLVYADDVVLLSWSASGLQVLLDSMNHFCVGLGLVISTTKTEVVVFNGPGTASTWRVGAQVLPQSASFKYLGLIFHESGTMSYALQRLAHNAVGACAQLRAKFRGLLCQKSFPMMRRLFDALVLPTVSYGSEVWGPFCSPTLPRDIKKMADVQIAFFRQLCRLKRSVTPAIIFRELSEMPWVHRWWNQVIGFMHRLSNMPEDSIHAEILRDNIADAQEHPSYGNWAGGIVKQYSRLGMVSPFSSSGITCLNSLGFQANMKGLLCRVWDGLHVSPRTAPSKRAKLCTYFAWFLRPSQLKTVPYFELPMPISRVRLLMQFRMGSHALPVEQGRLAKPAIPRHLRRCTLCGTRALGDERHFVFDCPHFAHIRRQFQSLYEDADGTMQCFVWHKDQKAVCHCLAAILNVADDSNKDASS